MTFVVWGIILGVKSDADFENEIFKRIFQRLGVVYVGFNVHGVVFRKIFIFFRLSRVGYRSGGCNSRRSVSYRVYKQTDRQTDGQRVLPSPIHWPR